MAYAASPDVHTHDALLERLQRDSFAFFTQECVRLRDGLFPDTSDPRSHASIASIGFAMGCYPIAAERGFIARPAAAAAVVASLRFLFASTQGLGPEASGYRGFFYHFLDRRTGRRAADSELSSIDTALLVAGALLAARWFDGAAAIEQEIRDRADALYRRVEWDWMCDGEATLRMGWKQDGGFLPSRWLGFNEGLLMYVLALGSPSHPVAPQGFHASVAKYDWRRVYDLDYAYAGPLFIHQMPHCFVDFRGIRDAFMREHDSDYFQNSRRATLVQQRYAIANADRFVGYGEFCWGITATNGPGPARRKVHGETMSFHGYKARGVPFGPDDGCIAPWAVAASLPFAPEIVLPTLRHFIDMKLDEESYGFAATINRSYRSARTPDGWRSPHNYGINQGPAVMMIENFRTGLPWTLMRGCQPIIDGLRRAGFTGGWLAGAATLAGDRHE